MLTIQTETKATLTTSSGGRVLAWVSDRERGSISIAVPADRTKLTPVEARDLATCLTTMAAEIERPAPVGATGRRWNI
ncbi:hypothetical protein [Streptacidiphilus sp. P02-A3a]|uniref:hypothetical protein n=1 Tax=Streptacidiphilus sp. P02-A3a TaxID=2704468 RepID=UPI0015FD9BA7|nr:hypothetical protein [Streptacidiphilus sp. P02-A3a]QMU72120.1 hypothetical protein GXP74_31665 [Streptacidiphilus sp. P02-A3a]